MPRADCIIVGAGLAGASVARHLVHRGLRDVVVLERETRPAVHSSGRSAEMVRQVISDEAIACLAREGARRIAEEAAASPEEPAGLFAPQGSLLLGGEEHEAVLRRDAGSARRAGLDVELLDPADAGARVEALRGAEFCLAVACRSDGMADAPGLVARWLREAEAHGARVRFGEPVREVLTDPGTGRIAGARSGSDTYTAPRLVNAAGAWAGELAGLGGARAVPLVPRRRHLWRTAPDPRIRADWPFVWDVERAAYFRPDRGGLLLCSCDSDADRPGDARSDPDVIAAGRAKVERVFPALAGLSTAAEWAGHRTFAPDGRFVLGEDPRRPGFFWAAGLGGHGVTTSPAVGRLVAAAVLDGALPPEGEPHRADRELGEDR